MAEENQNPLGQAPKNNMPSESGKMPTEELHSDIEITPKTTETTEPKAEEAPAETPKTETPQPPSVETPQNAEPTHDFPEAPGTTPEVDTHELRNEVLESTNEMPHTTQSTEETPNFEEPPSSKKYIIPAAIGAGIIIVGVLSYFLLFSGAEVEAPEAEETNPPGLDFSLSDQVMEEEDTEEADLFEESGLDEMTEKEKFVAATIEAACYSIEVDDILDPTAQNDLQDIYESYGFDEEMMTNLTISYENDEEVQTAIQEGIDACTPSGEDDIVKEETTQKKRR